MGVNVAVIFVPAQQQDRIANPLLGIFAARDIAERFILQQGIYLHHGIARPEEINKLTVGMVPGAPIEYINLRIDQSGFEARYLIVPLSVQTKVSALELAEAS